MLHFYKKVTNQEKNWFSATDTKLVAQLRIAARRQRAFFEICQATNNLGQRT